MKLFCNLVFVFLFVYSAEAQDSSFSQTEIIYGRKDGMALTMVKLSPTKQANRRAILDLVSGNWISGSHMLAASTRHARVYTDAGYTVFLVMHGSQPRYSIQDETSDIRRAVRYIRYNASTFQIEADHIGITGASSGGHLSLMTALVSDSINTAAADPVDRVSSRVQAAAVFFPPTDFLHWGSSATGVNRALIIRARVAGAFDFKKFNDKIGVYETVSSDSANLAIAKLMSPIYQVSADDPPVMIIHGDADIVVPLQQSQTMVEKLKAAGVPTSFTVKAGGGHGWRNIEVEEQKFVEWFDKYLK